MKYQIGDKITLLSFSEDNLFEYLNYEVFKIDENIYILRKKISEHMGFPIYSYIEKHLNFVEAYSYLEDAIEKERSEVFKKYLDFLFDEYNKKVGHLKDKLQVALHYRTLIEMKKENICVN